VFEPKNMSAARLTRETHRAYRRFYSWRRAALDWLRLMVNMVLDALVWNFGRAHRYALDVVFLRAAGKMIVARYAETYSSYVQYINELERERLLSRAAKTR
jgi:hypothetical protein